jgi:cysteine-rich repeat protein
MKKTKLFIIGTLITLAIGVSPQHTKATLCGPGDRDMYQKIYCDMDLYDNKDRDEDLIEILADQYKLDEEMIEMILSDTVCSAAKELGTADREQLPELIQTSCLSTDQTSSELLEALQVFKDIKNSYAKENAIKLNQESLEKKFEASEIYWDGELINSRFDLILDLNLIEYVLFGSGAEWLNDVYRFPAEGGGGEDDEVLLDDLLGDEDSPDDSDSPSDGGTAGESTDENEDGIPDDCVPADDPDADTGGPGSDFVNELCGNGVLDVLMGEQCDDGNLTAGDGCSQYCQPEANGAGNDGTDLQCIDPEAVTFRTPEDGSSSDSGSTDGSGTTNGTDTSGGSTCPPGTFPRRSDGTGGAAETTGTGEVTQSLQYPGPFIGGTMRQFPESHRPPCGPGESELTAESPGMEWLAGDGSVCIATEFLCANPNDARDFLFGSGWADDPVKREAALAIEATFCVNITRENRPLSPYSQYEGCIDCHITAMADALEEALTTNVTPLENTTSAFGISSKFGPSFSFNLSTDVKRKPKFQESDTAKDAIKEANLATEVSRSQNNPPLSNLTGLKTPVEIMTADANIEAAAINGMKEDSRLLMVSSDAVSDQESYNRIKPLLIQMKDSFDSIQSKWYGMVQSTNFDELEECRP